MESPRISLARVLELGVCVSWREALSIAHEAVARAGATEGTGPARLTAESCLLTRGGDVVLAGTAAQARPEVAVRLLDDLLASCSNPGRFSGAVADGTALDIIEQWSQDTTPKRRRAEVASVAIRGLAAEADAARAMAAADEQHPSADFDDSIAAPPPAASPTDFPRPWVTALGPPPAMPTIPDPTFSLLEDADDDNAEVRRPDLDHEDLIAAVEAAPPPAASPADRLWPRVAALAPPPAIPTIDDQTVALLGDSAVGDAEVRRPDLDHEDLVAAVDATPPPAASIPEQTFALLEDSAVGDAEIPSPGLDLEDLIAAVDKDLIAAIEAAPPPAASIPAQTFALLEDAAVGDAEVGPSLDLEGLIAAVDASPAPAASIPEQTFALLEDSADDDAEVRRPGLDHEDLVAAVDATPPPAASIPEQTFALLEDSAVGDAEVPGPGLDLEDLIAAIEAAPPPAASIDEQTFALLEDSAVSDAEVREPGLDHEDLIAAVDEDLIAAVEAAPPPAASPIPEQTFALLEDAAGGDAEVHRPGLDLEDLIAAVEAAPPPAASISEQTFALLEDAAGGDAEVHRPGLDLEDLIAAVEAAFPPAASISEQTFALFEDAAVGDAEVRPGLDLEDRVTAVDAAPAPAASIPEQTFALLEDAAVDDAEVRPNLDHDDLIAAVDAAPTPAAAPTDVLWPWVTALAPLSPIPTVHDQTFALLGDSALGDAEIRRPDLDHDDLVTAVDATPAPAASIPEQTFALLEDSAVGDAEAPSPGLDLEDLIAAVDKDLIAVVDAAPPPAASIPEQTFAQLEDSAVDDADVHRPGLDLEGLIAAVDAAPPPAASISEQTFALLENAAVDAAPPPEASPTDVPWPSVTALAPPSASPTIPDETFALLEGAAVGDAEVPRPGLDQEDLIAGGDEDLIPAIDEDLIVAVEAASPASRVDPRADVRPARRRRRRRRRGPQPTDVPRPSLAALAAPAAMPTIDDQTFALLEDSAFDDSEVRPGLDLEDMIAAVEAAREWTAPEDAVAALAIGTSPAPGTRPSVTLRPASISMDLPSAKPLLVNAVWTYVWGGYASSCDRVRRSSPAALVCSILALAAGGILGLQLPETRWSAVEPSEPAVEPPEFGAPVGRDGHTPRARRDPAFLHEVADTPSVPPLVARNAPRGSPQIEGPRARFTEVPDSYVWSMPRPARRPETPAKNTATVAGSRSLSTTSAAAALPAPGAANSAGAPPPAVDPSPVVASPSATASSPAQTFGSASNNVPVNVVARSSDGESETRAIENVLGRYRIAFNKLDAGAALAVWPTVNEKTLANAFERLESHDMSFRSCQIEIISVIAEAACSGSARYVPTVGSRTPKTEERRWRFMLRKARSGWLIETVDAR